MSDLRRFLLRARAQARSESGFTLVEALFALFLLAMIMTGVVAAAGTFNRATNLNRVRQQANAIASDAVEQARALSFNDLKLDPVTDVPNPNPPTSYADSDCTAPPNTVAGTCTQTAGTIVMGAANCSSCIQYRYTRTSRGVTYTVTQMVLKLSSFVDSNNSTQTLKKLIVKVDWNLPKPGTATVATILNNQDYLNAPTPTGVHIEVHDNGCVSDGSGGFTNCFTSPGAVINDPQRPGLAWTYTIKNAAGTTVASGQTDDGTADPTGLTAGAYTCTISNSAAGGTLGFYKMVTPDPPATPTYSFGCNGGAAGEAFAIVDGDTTNLVSQWTEGGCVEGTTKGFIAATVTQSEGGAAISGAKIAYTDVSNNTTNSANTNGSGQVTTQLHAGSYTASAIYAGWTAPDQTVCVYASNTVPQTVEMTDAPPAGTINVTIKNNSGINGTSYYSINPVPQGNNAAPPAGQTQVDKGKTSTAVKFTNAPADTYTITACRYDGAFTGNCTIVATKTGVVVNDLSNVNVALTDNG